MYSIRPCRVNKPCRYLAEAGRFLPAVPVPRLGHSVPTSRAGTLLKCEEKADIYSVSEKVIFFLLKKCKRKLNLIKLNINPKAYT